MSAFSEKRDRRIKQLYLAVKAQRPDLYEDAVHLADAARMRHNSEVSIENAAAIEIDAMQLVAKAAGIIIEEQP